MEVNTLNLALLADGTVIAPSLRGTHYRLSQTGQLIGVFKLGEPAGDPIALDDGTLVVTTRNTLHFIGAADFEEATPFPDLSNEMATLEKHFAPIALTPHCKQILKDILKRLVKVEREDERLKLGFLTDYEEVFYVTFGAPEVVVDDWPQSYRDVSALHSWIEFGNGPPDDIYFGAFNREFSPEEEEDFEKHYKGLCDAGQNWYIFGYDAKNKLGEPSILLLDHGGGFDYLEIFPDQDEEAFGVGGMLLRSLTQRVFSGDQKYDQYGCG